MGITFRLFSPAPLRDHVATWLRVLIVWLTRLADFISPQKQYHRGGAPMFGGPALTLPTDLEVAFGSIKAAILQKLLEWININERKGKTSYFYEGHYWTHMSYNKLQKEHFPTRHPDTLRKYIREMERQGFVISCQPDPTDEKWYRLDMKAISKAVQQGGKGPRGAGEKSRVKGQKPTPAGYSPTQRTTENLQIKNLKTKNSNTKQQQPTTETVVVVPSALPRREPEMESGEHSIDGEGHDTSAVKAFVPHEQHHDESPLSKVPLKVLSLGNELCADLIRFGVSPDRAQRMVKQYPEDDIRYVMDRARKASNVTNPPGFLVRELDKGKAGVLGLRAVQKDLHMPSTFIDEDRLEAIRRENARMEAEDRARAGQMMDPEPHLEKV